jgi:uncharacterized protein (TIGR02391 family)
MAKLLATFESIVRRAAKFSEIRPQPAEEVHPFDIRDIHPKFTAGCAGCIWWWPLCTIDIWEAFKYIYKEIQHLSGDTESGFKLMMEVFPESSPIIQLTPCLTTSEKDEQKGYQFLFAGSVLAIRNPRGQDTSTPSNATLTSAQTTFP